jgi:4-hydroxy-4-methyl-2-oxoglutarate aldolase
LKRNEIYVNTGSSPRNAMWGEMMCARVVKLGARGALTDGYVRDTRAILAMNFSAFCFGSYVQDSAPRYKVYDYRVPIEIGKVRIRRGDILFGDIDGVLVAPREAETEVFVKALEKSVRRKRQFAVIWIMD